MILSYHNNWRGLYNILKKEKSKCFRPKLNEISFSNRLINNLYLINN